MREGMHPGRRCIFYIQPEGSVSSSFCIALKPDLIFIGQVDGPGIVVTADPTQGAEAMVKGAVLLHQDDDMFGIKPGTAFGGVDGQGALDGSG